MTSKEKIIKFMELKSEALQKYSKHVYFVEADKKAILKWDDKDCDDVWGDLLFDVDCNESLSDMNTCPFCIMHDPYSKNRCKDFCEYAGNHGVCGNNVDSTYDKILQELYNGNMEPTITRCIEIPKIIKQVEKESKIEKE